MMWLETDYCGIKIDQNELLYVIISLLLLLLKHMLALYLLTLNCLRQSTSSSLS